MTVLAGLQIATNERQKNDREEGNTMVRQIWLRETGSADVLKIENVPSPEPKAGEVRIRVKAIGLNRSEVNLRAGTYGKPPKFPVPIGLEAAGTIDALGAGVSQLKVGDAVSVAPAFDTSSYGMYGDEVVARPSSRQESRHRRLGRGGGNLDVLHDRLGRAR
jgi:NADPH:quinone reductase-like Zn-dependent oxidoreductase